MLVCNTARRGADWFANHTWTLPRRPSMRFCSRFCSSHCASFGLAASIDPELAGSPATHSICRQDLQTTGLKVSAETLVCGSTHRTCRPRQTAESGARHSPGFCGDLGRLLARSSLDPPVHWAFSRRFCASRCAILCRSTRACRNEAASRSAGTAISRSRPESETS